MSLSDLFLPLDRAGPGDAESLHWALAVAGTPPTARVLDAGCGTGADLPALLAALPGARVTALDASAPFIARVRARFPTVQALVGDMAAPPGGPWDLIWSAGAVYNLGVATALTAWRDRLAPGGRVAFSDLRKTGRDLPEGCAAFWASEGLVLRSAADLEAEIASAGYRLLGARWVGPAGWAAYYEPVERALAGCADPALVAAFRAEIACWRQWGDSFDYRLVVVEPT